MQPEKIAAPPLLQNLLQCVFYICTPPEQRAKFTFAPSFGFHWPFPPGLNGQISRLIFLNGCSTKMNDLVFHYISFFFNQPVATASRSYDSCLLAKVVHAHWSKEGSAAMITISIFLVICLACSNWQPCQVCPLTCGQVSKEARSCCAYVAACW